MKEPRGMHSAVSASTRSGKARGAQVDAASNQPQHSQTTVGKQQRIMWIDGVGGYMLLDTDEVVIGQAYHGSPSEICIVGDLSRQAAAIRRSDGDYLIQPLQPTRINDCPIDRPQLLSDGCEIQLGDRVRLAFSKPSPLSATARLELVSLNKFKPTVDGILLLSDSCVLGPNAGSHVVCPTWSNEILMFRHQAGWYFRTLDEVEVDGKLEKGQIPLVAGMRINGNDFSLSIE